MAKSNPKSRRRSDATQSDLVTVYPERSVESKLGVDSVRRHITELCITEAARELSAAFIPSKKFEQVSAELRRTAEMKQLMQSEQPLNLGGISDVRKWLSHLRTQGSFIEPEELAALRDVMRNMLEIKNRFAKGSSADDDNGSSAIYPLLTEMSVSICDVRDLIGAIERVLAPDASIKDNASPALSEIRRQLSSIGSRISRTMRRVLTDAVSQGLVEPDTKPAVRDGRIVVPVAAMNKRKIPGIVHDESATGKTYFIEPAEIVELNNEQRELEIEERREIVRILTELAVTLRPHIEELTESFAVVARFDFIRAKALFAVKVGGELPHLSDRCVIEWHDARHPILRLSLESVGRSVVPLDIDLTADTARILVISGPNAGGKSVALKTLGINQYLLQSGILPVMDANSRVGIFSSLFVDLGDEQSMEDDLSTYSSHLRNMKYILSHGDGKSLILIDEFGSGTEPQIGGAIAQALLSEFNAKGMWGVITTHYQNLKQYANSAPGIMNGSMLYDRQAMKPIFKLLQGTSGSSFAVEIALRTGIPRSVIDEAERIVGSDYFNLDKYLLDINRDRRYWENKRADIKRREKHLEEVIHRYEENAENLRQQRRVILDEAKSQADSIIARSNAAVEQTIRSIRESNAAKDATREARSRLADERQAIASETPQENKALEKAPHSKKPKPRKPVEKVSRPIEVGDTVLIDKQGQPGQVMELQKDKAVVSFGMMKITVPVDRLSHTMRKAASATANQNSALSRQTIDASRQRQLSFSTELDVRGMRADEAIQAVTYFLDDAMQFNADRIRILHGTGTGALRVAIRQYLRTVPGITSFHDEDVRFGGAGITVINL